MAAIDPRQMVTCPYNAAHQIEHYRLHIHLQKCRKQYPHCKKVTCPFDATHVVNDVELDYHINICPKRQLFDNQMYVMDDDMRPVVPVVTSTVTDTSEENWDEENVTLKLDLPKKAHIITKIKGATPSERRKHRMEGIKTYRPQEEVEKPNTPKAKE